MTNQALAAVGDDPTAENAVRMPAQADTEPMASPETSLNEVGVGPWKRPGYAWRWPSAMEVSRCITGLVLAATVSGFVPDGSATVAAGAEIALHSVAELVAACFRRARR
ncbi:hypothetical protein ACFQ7A_05535 [Streptomyces sp. NPDC056528]|uniref:hypothetical protein n=1 Tax=Streptomyces sp. NPDC056528 TaxID=3345854 RepID=UPI003696D084